MLYFCRGSIVSFQEKSQFKELFGISKNKDHILPQRAAEWEQETSWCSITFQQKGSSRGLSGEWIKKKNPRRWMIRCTGTKGAMCCSSEQSFYHSGCSTLCILPSHFHLRWDTVWSMCRFTCRFPESCTLKRECWIERFLFCTISPFQYLFFLTSKQCLCHSELQIPSNISGTWRERTKGVCRFLETSCRELPGFEYFQNSGPLVGAEHWNVWPGISIENLAQILLPGRRQWALQLWFPAGGAETTPRGWSRRSRKMRCDGLSSCRHQQPAHLRCAPKAQELRVLEQRLMPDYTSKEDFTPNLRGRIEAHEKNIWKKKNWVLGTAHFVPGWSLQICPLSRFVEE